MTQHKIEYVTRTWNPVTGCTKTESPGCQHCWAERMSKRLAGRAGYDAHDPFRPTFHAERLHEPLTWRYPQRVAVSFMGDLFHPNISPSRITQIFAVMLCAPQHRFLVLTKRPARANKYIDQIRYTNPDILYDAISGIGYEPEQYWNEKNPPAHIAIGTSISNQDDLESRLSNLMWINWPNLFISAEPLLEQIDIQPETLSRFSWLIAGGESGPGARPCHPDWARGLRDQCAQADVPFYFKQWGEWYPIGDYYGLSDEIRDRELDWPHRLITSAGAEWFVGDKPTDQHDGQPPSGTCIMKKMGKRNAGHMLDGMEHRTIPAALLLPGEAANV